MTIDLYQTDKSGPCRSIRMLAKALEIELNLIEVNLQNGDHLKEEFLAVSFILLIFMKTLIDPATPLSVRKIPSTAFPP